MKFENVVKKILDIRSRRVFFWPPDSSIFFFEKFRNVLKPWKYMGFFLAQPSIEWMLYGIKRYYED